MKTTTKLFEQLLQISSPFSVARVEYKAEESHKIKQSVHIYINVSTSMEVRPQGATIHDYESRTWRHLNLFQYPCYLHCTLPKYKYRIGEKTEVKTLQVPWSKEGSGFTLLFEDFAIELVKNYGCVAEVARQIDIYPQRLWLIIEKHAKEILSQDIDMSKVRRIGFDETSKKKGREYITCFIDLDTGELLYIVEGKSSDTVVAFEKNCKAQGIDKELITDISIDMSPAFISGVEQIFPNANITFDKFHVSQLVQKAFDSIRKSFGRKAGGTINKWIFFRPYHQLTSEQQIQLDDLLVRFPVLDIVYELKNDFSKLWQQKDKLQASAFLAFWSDTMRTFKKKVLTTLANTLDKHHQRIIHVIESQINNAILEGFNSKIQNMKRKARGYKDVENLILMIRLHCAK